MLKLLSEKILDMLFPVSCVGCGKDKIIFCGECTEKHLHIKSSPDKKIISIFNYRDKVVKELIWKLKYTGNKKISLVFAQILYDKILEDISEQEIFSNFTYPMVIPIPLSKRKMRKRGFNQSEEVAKNVALIDRNKSFSFAPNVLHKVRDTTDQSSIKDREARLKNLDGCFFVKDTEIVRGKNIIIIDDVTTTGATITEAMNTLHKAGAKNIIAFTIAH